jgi:hypothetical protein
MSTTNSNPRRQRSAAKQATAQRPKKGPSRLDQLQSALLRDHGASIAEMVEITSWQAHSIRGAMAAALKKRGLIITSLKTDGVRRYRAERAA